MPEPLDCPGIESWRLLLGDAIPPDQRERYERHLEACVQCQERLRRTEEGEELQRLGRRVGDPTLVPTDPALTQVLENLYEVNPTVGS